MLIIFMLVVQIYALLEFGVFLVNVNFMFANIYTHAYATVLRLMYISPKIAWYHFYDTENFISVVTPKMRRMQDTLQDRATFITFVNARNQRMINCDWYFTMIDTPSMGEYLHFLYFTNFNIKMIPCNFRAYAWLSVSFIKSR
jgi:hypothetical protein